MTQEILQEMVSNGSSHLCDSMTPPIPWIPVLLVISDTLVTSVRILN